MIKHATGNIITMAKNGDFEIIVHGCNCFNTMGSGIAKQIKEEFPRAWSVDQSTHKGNYSKLGNYTSATEYIGGSHELIIVNAYTQYHYNSFGETKDLFEYASFELILQKLAHDYGHLKFGLPCIGMGLAGGDSVRIVSMIEKFAEEVTNRGGSVTLVEFKP